HIRRADGEIIQSVWLRENAPFASVIKARLPSAESLEKYFSNPPEDAQFSMVGTFRQDGLQRKLTIRIHVPADQTGKSSATSQSVSELLQESANGISQTRIAVANGTIIQAKGFIVASDGQSALLDVSNILNTLQSEGGNSEFWLLWKINQ
ncbi:MAG: hypothetical protein KDA91_26150, partial [Planctomycetaceae bacterium]|nr:hypothetical protein [Planctomycetaceae bacterium]